MRSLLLSFILLGITSMGYAQQTRTISLQGAIEIAIENNYSLEQARNNQDAAAMQVRSAKADFLPSLSTSFSGSKNIGRQFNEITGEVGDFTSNSFGGGLSANLDVFSGFQKFNSLKSSQLSAQAQRNNVDRIRETIIFETASRYLDLLVNKELYRIDQQNLESSREQLKKIRQQVKLGALPKADLYNQQSTVANNKLAVTNSKNAVKMSRLRLIRQLQLSPEREYQFVSPDISADSTRIAPKSYDLDQLIDISIDNRDDLKRQQQVVKSNQYQLQVAKGAEYPSVSLSSSFSSSYNDRQRALVIGPDGDPLTGPNNQPITEIVPFEEQFFDRNISRSLRLNLSIPIFSNLNRDNQIVQQRISYKNAKLELENQRLQVVQEVTQAYNDYESIVQRLESTREALRAARLAYETVQERYNVGSASFIELNQSNANYVEAQSNRIQAVYNYLFQKELLNYYIGELDHTMSLEELQKSISN